MVEIVPSILAADFACLADEIAKVERAGVSMLHIDIMDGHFVPNLTMGPPLVESIRKRTRLQFDCHLMIQNPEKFAPIFIRAGAGLCSVHCESTPNLDRALHLVQEQGARAGVVLNPATPVEMVQNVLDFVDYVLVMSVNPGYGGQKFIRRSLDKVRSLNHLRRENGWNYKIEIDGGVSRDNVAEIARAGCDWMVAGTSVFGSEDPAAAVKAMQQAAAEIETVKV